MPTVSAAAGTITEYALPPNGGWCSCPAAIVLGPDGNLWFTENGGAVGHGAIGMITTAGIITEYALSTYNSSPVGITSGPGGTGLWFTEQNTNRIGDITPTGAITEFNISLSGSQPRGIVLGPDSNMWFTQSLANATTTTCKGHRCTTSTSTTTGYIGRITPNGTISEFAIPYAYSRPFWITSGPDGNLWFTDEGNNSVGRITAAGAVTEFPLPNASTNPGAHGITTGSDHNLWVAEAYSSKLAQVTTGGTINEFSATGGPAGIVTGPDNNLWFTEATNTSAIGTMSTSGTGLTSYSLGTAQYKDPQGITIGSDGRLWFTEEFGGSNGAIGVITTS
jgi:streptogramin lyase